MNGFTFTPAAVSFSLVVVLVFPLTVFATTNNNDVHTLNTLGDKLGCMMCHQGESAPSDQHLKKNQDKPHRQKSVEDVSAG